MAKTVNVRIVEGDGFWTKLFIGLMIFGVVLYVAVYVAIAFAVLWLIFTEPGRRLLVFTAKLVVAPFLIVGFGLHWLAKRVWPKKVGKPELLAISPPTSDDAKSN